MSAASLSKTLDQWCKSLKSENELNKKYTRSKYKFKRSPRFMVGGKLKSE
jgi:hypothetical protein